MLGSLIDRALARDPDKTAIVWGTTRTSYAQLAEGIERYAAGFTVFGLGVGDAIGVVLPNRPEFIIAFFAAMRIGVIVAPANPLATVPELARLFADARPRMIICDAARLAVCQEAVNGLADQPRMIVIGPDGEIDRSLRVTRRRRPAAQGRAESRALYLYTSGSTDTFKRVCCTQSNLWYEAENFITSTGIDHDDVILCAVPLYHSYGFGNGLLDAAFAGATLVLERSTELPFAARYDELLQLIRIERVTVLLAVPFQYEVLAAADTADIAATVGKLRWCVSSGDLLKQRTFEAFRRRTGQPIRSLYGSTEAGSIAMNLDPADAVAFGDLGSPLANVTIEVRGEASGGAGEIWVKSPTLPPGGYDNRPDLTATAFHEGFYNSGDLGRLDARGHLWMSGRKQSFTNVGGHKVDLGEVEEVLLSHPQVREAAVIGIDVPMLGGVLKAVVAAAEASRESDILAHCRRHLAPFKVPRFIEFREMLPRSPLGKVLRAELETAADWLVEVSAIDALPAGSHAMQVDWLARQIQEQVAAILRCKASDVRRDVAFQNLGLDSLRVIELQERLSRLTGVALSITTLWNYPSVEAYAGFLRAAMTGGGMLSIDATSRVVTPQGATQPDMLDELSDAEIARLLARELDRNAEDR
jgi:long-chain acyl-CoA synthetase